MRYFGQGAIAEMALVSREPRRLLFSDPFGDLIVEIEAGQPTTVSVITTHWPTEAQDFLKRLAGTIDGIIHYEALTDQPAQEVLRRARDYFGQSPEGLGLILSAERPETLEFSGGGGQVWVAVHTNGQTTVRVAAREWGYQAEHFVRSLSSER